MTEAPESTEAGGVLRRWGPLVVLLFGGALLLVPRPSEGYLRGDALTYAAIMKGLVGSDDWMALEFGDDPYFRKPPLMFWLGAAAFRLFGATGPVARVVGAVPSLALLAAVYLLARRWYGRDRAFLATLAVATSYVFLRNGGVPRMDTALALLVVLAVAVVAAGERRPGLLWLFWIPVGLGLLLKGPAGLLPVAVVGAWSAVRRTPFPWNRGAFWAGLPAAPAVVLPWVLHNLEVHGEAFYRGYVEEDLVATAAVSSPLRATPLEKYPVDLVREWWPWLPFILHGAWIAFRRVRRGDRDARWSLPLAWCLAVGVVLLSLRTAYSRYLIPVLPATGILVAFSVTTLWKGFREAAVTPIVAGIVAAGALFVALWPGSLHSDEVPPVVAWREELGLSRGGARPLFLGARVPRTVQAGAIFYEDTQVEAVDGRELLARVRAGGPVRALVLEGGRDWPDGLQGTVLRVGEGRVDLVEFRLASVRPTEHEEEAARRER